MSNKGGNKREKFLESVRKQKLDTVRWSLGAGGQSPSVRDDEGYTSIMIAAAGNLHKVLRMLVDHTRKTREREQMDLKDGAGDGRTALMMAAAHGHAEACQELLDAGCNFRLKCDRGKTAAEYASKAGHDALAARINRGGESEEEDTDEEDDIDPDAPEGETATQRSKRKKKELEAKERRGGAVDEHAAQEAARRAEKEAEELAAAVLKKEMPTPVWEEVQKAIQAESKELTLEGTKGLAALPSGAEVDPAVWWATATNNLKMCRLGMTRVPDEISRLAGLKTLILSNNNLTTLPDAIGDLSQLKVLEVEDNALSSLPASLKKCGALENLRLANNALTDSACDALAGCVTLVTLVLDGNPNLRALEGLAFETKERLVTFSAKRCAVASVPESVSKCSLLAELFLSDNQIRDLPMALGELKEKKVRALDFENNPLSDPKVKKMIGKSANLVKELLVYVRKNGVRGGGGGGGKGGKGKKGKGKKKAAVSSDEEASEDEETRVASPPPPEQREAPVSVPTETETPTRPGAARDGDSDSDSEDEEELRERMSRMSKKERVKAERKLAERRSAKAARAAAKKRAEMESAAAAQRAAALDANALGDDDESDIDSDDEEALLERKQRARAAAAGGGAYTLTPEQRAAAEQAEAERLARVRAERDAAEAAEKAARDAKDAEEAFAKLRLKEAADGVVMTWLYEKGAIQRKPGGIPFKPGKKPGEPPTILCVVPAMVVGRIIGKAGATIREIEARSKARVSIQEGKGGPGMATLSVVGDDRAAESVRMMVNNAVGGGKR